MKRQAVRPQTLDLPGKPLTNYKELPISWKPIAIVLVKENRTCTACNSNYTVPSGVFLQVHRTMPSGLMCERLIATNVRCQQPSKIVYVDTDINGCQKCLVTGTENQVEMFEDDLNRDISIDLALVIAAQELNSKNRNRRRKTDIELQLDKEKLRKAKGDDPDQKKKMLKVKVEPLDILTDL